jgi:hypothetical protein
MTDAVEKLRKKMEREHYDQDSFRQLDIWQKQLEELEALEGLRSHFVITDLLTSLQTDIAIAQKRLHTDRTLPDSERQYLFGRVDEMTRLKLKFESTEAQRKTIEKTINDQL